MREARSVSYVPGFVPEGGRSLPLPYRYVGGYVYTDDTCGMVYTGKTTGIPLPVQRHSVKNFHDEEAVSAAVEILNAAPIGSVYVYTCTHYEDGSTDTHVFLKISETEWADEF